MTPFLMAAALSSKEVLIFLSAISQMLSRRIVGLYWWGDLDVSA
jgi:hypothetical protein